LRPQSLDQPLTQPPAPSSGRARVLVIIPCFNEARMIGQLLDEIHKLGAGYDTLVVDDGSSDATYEIAVAKSECVRLICNLGIGGAVQTGIKYAHSHGYDFCVQVDGDGQHPPDQVQALLEAQAGTKANLMIGSRYRGGDTDRSTWARRQGSRIIARVLGMASHAAALTDPTSGLRLMDRKAIAFFAQRYPHDFPEPISIAWALRHGLKVAETPVRMRAREHGTTSIAGLKALSYMVRVVFYILLARFEPRIKPRDHRSESDQP
jgi:glycosyltransferase involved in cell wall biosynthesis